MRAQRTVHAHALSNVEAVVGRCGGALAIIVGQCLRLHISEVGIWEMRNTWTFRQIHTKAARTLRCLSLLKKLRDCRCACAAARLLSRESRNAVQLVEAVAYSELPIGVCCKFCSVPGLPAVLW